MGLWSVVLFAAIASVAASLEPPQAPTTTPVFPEDVNEGLARTQQSRIVSGWEAVEGQFPYQISLRMVNPNGGVNACGGSIIHEEWGLTAAHCTAMRVTMVVRAGSVNLTRTAYLFESTEYYNHPAYIDEVSQVQPHDIGVIKFPIKLTWSRLVQPIRMQSSKQMNKDYSGVTMTAAGWGRTWTNGNAPENMNWVFLRGTSNLLCLLSYNLSPIIVDSTICASYYNVSSQSTCQGDSGGTLTVVDDDGQVTQVGVTSFVSATGCHTDFPAGFIRPGHYHEWFTTVTGIDFDWDSEESSEESESSDSSESSGWSESSSSEESTETTEEEDEEIEEVAQNFISRYFHRFW